MWKRRHFGVRATEQRRDGGIKRSRGRGKGDDEEDDNHLTLVFPIES